MDTVYIVLLESYHHPGKTNFMRSHHAYIMIKRSSQSINQSLPTPPATPNTFLPNISR